MSVIIRDHKSRIAPTYVGVFLLSFHSILSLLINPEKSLILSHHKIDPITSDVLKQINDYTVLSINTHNQHNHCIDYNQDIVYGQ